MRQQQQQDKYLPGTIVFAKLKGYPWWPARIEDDHSVPAKVLKQKSKSKGLYTVFFYGSKDYGFFGPDAIRPFDRDSVENDLEAKKFKTKDLELAVRQALEYDPKKSKRKSRQIEVDETAIGLDNTKKRRKSMSIEPQVEDIKKTPEYKKVYHIRHRLQRLVYNKQEGEIPKEDYSKILQIVKEIEEAPMSYSLLKDTKIGKVVKAACSYPFQDDTAIRDRCQQLMRNWKTLYIDPQAKDV